MERCNDCSIVNENSGLSREQAPTTLVVSGSGASPFREPYLSSDASLFSSSLPVLSHKKVNHKGSEDHEQFLDASVHLKDLALEDERKDLLVDLESNEVVLLPDDEEELLAGIAGDLDLSELPTQMEDLEDYDFFGSGGGLELDLQEKSFVVMPKPSISDEIVANGISAFGLPNGIGTVAGEHPYGEHPSRTLFVRNINSNVEDSELRSLFEQYGDIRTLYTACKHRGFVMISYFDIRHARAAMRALQSKPLRRRKLDIHFSIPKDNPSEKDINQGTLVVFNLDPSVSNDDLYQIFGVHGEIKEIRETPHKRHHKFIEFYDVRDAEAALKALNRSDIAGKRIKLEPSRPGGTRRNFMQQVNFEFDQDESRSYRQQTGSPLGNSPPGSWAHYGSPVEHNFLHTMSKSPRYAGVSPGLASVIPLPVSTSSKISPIGGDFARSTQANQIHTPSSSVLSSSFQHAHSFPGQKFSTSPASLPSFTAASLTSNVGTLSGPQFLWGSPSPYSEQSNSSVWSASSREGSLLGSHHHHHVGSAPSGIPINRRFEFLSKTTEAATGSPPAFGTIGSNRTAGSYMLNYGARGGVALPVSTAENGSPCRSIPSLPRPIPSFPGNDSYLGPGLVVNDGFPDISRIRRVDNSFNQLDNKKQYQLDLDRIFSGEDARTTLMIKNIPNKYTSKMLLAAIDECHAGTYDFLYLPIDFKNKCNVGYAFINMVSPSHIIPFYKAFNGKKWEKFNSEKVTILAYARIQGKAALISHFQNSSLMNEDKCFRPILFRSENQTPVDEEGNLSENLNLFVRQSDGSYSGDASDGGGGAPEGKS